VPTPSESQATVTLEPGRRRLILDRLQADFYGESAPAERIASAVLVALYDLDKGSALPH
jgi:hypothetical protein